MQESPSQASKFLSGEFGLPPNYPVPQNDTLLLYIQQNRDFNTVLYEVNLGDDGEIVDDMPIKAYWKLYSQGSRIKKLNHLQISLAYGYNFRKIRNNYFEIEFVAEPSKKFYLRKYESKFKIVSKINEVWSYVENIYVFVENLGLFPKVKYAELYGSEVKYQVPVYQKIHN